MLCENCGTSITVDSRFCRICGAKNNLNRELRVAEETVMRQPYSWQAEEAPRTAARTSSFTVNDARYVSSQSPNNTHNVAFQQRVFHCPHCYSTAVPKYEKRISQGGWIVFAVLAFTFPFLCWIGLFIKEDKVVCRLCNHTI